jgi:hypothetical protein
MITAGDFPPSSNVHRASRLAHTSAMCFPAATLPVKLTLSISGLRIR